MSIQKIIQESIAGNPLEMKEALAGELRSRVAEALAEKIEELDEAASFEGVLKAHKYSGSGKNYTGIGGTKVTHYGDHVISYNEADGKKVHKTPSSLNKHLNLLHDHEVSLKNLKEEAELDEAVSFKKTEYGDHHIHYNGKPVGKITKTSSMGNSGYSVRIGGNTSKHEVADESSLKAAKDSAKWHLTSNESPVKMKEEVEQIDELSKKTLGSYIKKASDSAASKGIEYGTKKAQSDEMDRMMNRHMSYSDKDKVRGIMGTTSKDVNAPREKAARRLQGIDRATDRLTK